MKFRDIKIGTQLILGFSTMMSFVIILGVGSEIQSSKIHHQTEILYEHPLQIRKAISNIKIDILNMRIGTRDLTISSNDKEKEAALQQIELASADITQQFNVLNQLYLGPKSDVDNAYKAFIRWKTARDVNTKLALEGDIGAVKQNTLQNTPVGKFRSEMMDEIQIVENYASRKAETLYANSNKLENELRINLIFLTVFILIFSVIILLVILRNIKKPINELINAAKLFENGDLDSRSLTTSKNEFGVLSSSFNSMVETIQTNIELNRKSAELSTIMLQEEEPRDFFNSLLPTLALQTNSQMAAVYLLSQDKKQFEHFVSFGMSDMAKHSFAVDSFEGEFGAVLSTRKISIIKRIPKDTRFLFHTVSGKLVPREIITVPIITGKEIVAIISIASVRTYPDQASLLIKKTLDTLTSRIEGVLSYQRIQEFSKKLESQNRELEAQKIEMQAQSIELTEQNRELEMHKVQLDEANKLKTSFLSNMSHELRTPLNSVIALSGVLSRKLHNKIPSDEYSYLGVIERNGKHLLSLINDILDISRIESGREEIDVSKFAINDLISDVVSMIKPQVQQKNLELIQNSSSGDTSIRSDFDKCRHILQNLVGNAVKFTEKGTVEIGAVIKEHMFEIYVKDTGIGISENNIDRIFDEFRQADASTSRRFGGTGLGLAIAKKYANLLGGDIVVDSKLNSGSIFTVSLPLNYSGERGVVLPVKSVTDPELLSTKALLEDSTNKTLLVVGDCESTLNQIKYFLEKSGYRIQVAAKGNKVLEIIKDTMPDGIILDLMEPDVEGIKLLQTIHETQSGSRIPVLALTARYMTEGDLEFLKRNNVRQLIQKEDINISELLDAIASMLLHEQ